MRGLAVQDDWLSTSKSWVRTPPCPHGLFFKGGVIEESISMVEGKEPLS